MKMKTEPSHEDPISAAAAVLLRAIDHAKRAVSESQAMCGILAAKIKDLEDAMKLQGADLDARALSAKRDLDLMLADRYRGMVESQKKLESVLALSTRLETKVTDKDGTIADLRTQLLSVRSAVAMERSRPRFSPVDPPELATSLPVGAFMAQGISLAQVGAAHKGNSSPSHERKKKKKTGRQSMQDRKGDRCDRRPSLEISIIRVYHHESKKGACF
ncbi:hypothetical protein B0H13DRAFT_1863411 [Mycena leptocephala]|nr:hypothetical protein B0H13DRAFT_1863411 [Mycena leptocephala]